MSHGKGTAFHFANAGHAITPRAYLTLRTGAPSNPAPVRFSPPKTPLPFLLGSGSVARAIRWEALRAPLHN